MRVLRILCCALAVAAFAAPKAGADEFNKQTFLTFSGPVQVPGATLPAGTYMFKLADLQGNRHVVQIFDKDGTKLYTTILAIPDQRLEPADKPVVMFTETAASEPPAIKAWFYPGDTIGDEFVYPRREAMRIAQATHQPVLSRSDESDVKTGEVARVDESGNTVNAEARAKETETAKPTAPAAETATTGQSAETNRNANQRPAENPNRPATAGTTGTATTTEPRPSTANRANQANQPTGTSGQATPDQSPRRNGQLPKTASPLALYELVSGLALAGAYGVRRLRNRR
jgi:hypothetical protein